MSSSSTLFASIRWSLIAAVVIAAGLLGTLGVRSWLAAHDAVTQLTAEQTRAVLARAKG